MFSDFDGLIQQNPLRESGGGEVSSSTQPKAAPSAARTGLSTDSGIRTVLSITAQGKWKKANRLLSMLTSATGGDKNLMDGGVTVV